MRMISLVSSQQPEMTIVEFLRTGMSFEICWQGHRWPPSSTLNAFLQCGYDDVLDGSTIRWVPFVLSEVDYLDLLGTVDPGFEIDALATEEGDWRRWFEVAVERLRA